MVIRNSRGLWIGKLAEPELARVREAARSPVFASNPLVQVEHPGIIVDGGIDFFVVRDVGTVAVADGVLSPPGDTDVEAIATRKAMPPAVLEISDALLFSPLRDLRVFPVGAAVIRRFESTGCKPRHQECEVPSWIPSDASAKLDRDDVLKLRSLAAHCYAVEAPACMWPIRMRYCMPGESELFPKSLTHEETPCP
jgi:hypothetical protein